MEELVSFRSVDLWWRRGRGRKMTICSAGELGGEQVGEGGEAAVGGEGEGGFGFVVLEAGGGAVFEEDAGDGEVAFDGGQA